MSKYQPLGDYLARQSGEVVEMTFSQIEKVLGFALPASSRYRAWWSNNGFNNVMTSVWLAAGFRTEQVDLERGRLVFRRAMPAQEDTKMENLAEGPAPFQATVQKRRHPLFGWMKGMITIAPDTDLTEPADPDLADYLDQKYGREQGGQQAS